MVVYLLILNFRTPPFQTVFSYPNVLKDTLITLDGFFSFAQHYIDDNWRDKYLKDLVESINDRVPKITTSYLMPSIRKNYQLSVFSPYNTEIIFSLENSTAYLNCVNKAKRAFGGNVRICIAKRSAITKVLSIKDAIGIDLVGGLSKIQERRGAYRDVFYEVRISRTNLLWSAIAKGNLNDIKRFMKIALKTGIGKKRNMGWGDLKSFYIYEVRNNNDININERMITYRDERHEYCELLRPHTTSDIIAVLRNNYTLLECDLTHGAVNPPYWRKNLVVSRAKFVKVL